MLGIGKPARPQVVAFDVIGTLFPLEPLRPGIAALGLPPTSLEGWFAAGLRDAFALAAAGDFQPFASVLESALAGVLAEQGLTASADLRKALVKKIETLPCRGGAPEALEVLRDAGIRIIAITNGSRSSTQSLLQGADLDGAFEHIVSVDDVKLSKPRPEVYRRGLDKAGVKPGQAALLAVHPWDINGAKAAGLVTAYLSAQQPFPPTMRAPDLTAATLPELARALARL